MPPSRVQLARYLRRTMSGVEWNLWSCLRRRQLEGFKFRRKALIGPYIVDFACLSARLVVEISGVMYDGFGTGEDGRDAWLASRDFRLVRFSEMDVAERIDQVLDTIRAELAGRPQFTHAPRPLPDGERGFIRAGPGRGFSRGRRTRPYRRAARAP